MCGIIGYTGEENSVPKLLEGLKSLEYRGYDSAGIAVFEDKKITVIKSKGRITDVEQKIRTEKGELFSTCGIGHTRWATHGEPSDVNSHPHGTENLSIVHNGIIENYLVLKQELLKKGYTFLSETDTEVAAAVIDYTYIRSGADPIAALRDTMNILEGSYAIGVVFRSHPGTIYAIRKDNPLIIARASDGNFIASDIPAVLRYTNRYYQLEYGEIAVITRENVTILGKDGTAVQKEEKIAHWDRDAAEKGGYPHFMIKEIHEEPASIVNTIRPRVKDGLPCFDVEALDGDRLAGFRRVIITACGTAMHAGLVGKNAIETLARIPAEVEIASEFRYKNPIVGNDDLVLIISQSGETADTLAALRLAKERGAYTVAIVNVAGSSIAREADSVIYTWAGPEIAVASTKAYIVQASVMLLLAVRLALVNDRITESEAKSFTDSLLQASPNAIQRVLNTHPLCRLIAEQYKETNDLFFIGRGIDYAAAQEASLKLKEISYIHSEAYAAGELKHGTISLIDKGTPVVAICTQEALLGKMVSNIKEVKARGAKVLLILREGLTVPQEAADHVITVPSLPELLMPLPVMALLQLFAYDIAVSLGRDVDKPRNLAKSVTVE